MLGTTINGYTVQRNIDSGGMSDVYYAQNTLGLGVAIKVLKQELTGYQAIVERFNNEARTMVTLKHPNICQVIDLLTLSNGQPAIIMEYLDGQNLRNYIDQRKPNLPLKEWFVQAIDALRYAHAKGVIHRDIKPSNLFITNSGQLKLLDFGIAKVKASLTATQTGQTLGTVLYMSPEQVKDPKRVNHKTDIYSLGVTFYHALSGKSPYDADTDSAWQIQTSIVQKDLSLDHIDTYWQPILQQCLEKDPVNRPGFDQLLLSIDDKNIISEAPTVVALPKAQQAEKKVNKKVIIGTFVVFFIAALIAINHTKDPPTIIAEPIEDSILTIRDDIRLESKKIETTRSKKKILPPAIIELENNIVYVEGGTFQMGCTDEQGDCSDNEKPVHRVSLDDYRIGRYEVTQAQWQAVMGENPSDNKGCSNCPVESVSWDDIQVFLRKLNSLTDKNYRLPSEAEWEYAARGGDQGKRTKYSGSNNLNLVAWYQDNSGIKTHPVGGKIANELGLFDMSGNIWEWCGDCWHEDYSNAPTDGRTWLGADAGNCRRRVLRGSSSGHNDYYCRVWSRYKSFQNVRFDPYGFRVVLD